MVAISQWYGYGMPGEEIPLLPGESPHSQAIVQLLPGQDGTEHDVQDAYAAGRIITSAAYGDLPAGLPNVLDTRYVPEATPARTPTELPVTLYGGGDMANGNGNGKTTIQPGDDLFSILTSLLPGGRPADWEGLIGKAALPIAGLFGAGATAAFVGSQAIGVQYPWETGPGEGFIAPWNRDIVKDENGRWVTRSTRPDLFPGGAAGGAGGAGGAIGGSPVVRTWNTARDGRSGWNFWLTQDGRIHTYNRSGVLKSWKPKKPITLARGSTTLSQAVKAQRYLDKMWRNVAKRTKALKLA